MAIEPKLHSLLTGTSGVTALCAERVYPITRPQAGALPAVVFQRLGGFRVNSLSGYSTLENAEMEVTAYAIGYTAARQLAEAVISAMSSATAFASLLIDSPLDIYDDETKVYGKTMTFRVWNRE